jgi:hypothetical protein
MLTPSFGDHLRMDSVFEPVHRETFITELAVERLIRSVLPRFTGFDERRIDVLFGQPLQHRFRNELGSMIRSQYLRSPVNADQFGEYLDDTARADTPRHVDGQRLSGVLVDHRQTLQLLPIGASVKYEVVSPDPVLGHGRYRPRPRTADTSSRPFLRHLQPLRRPDPIRPVGAHRQAAPLKKDLDTAILEAGILTRQITHRRLDGLILRRHPRAVAERRARHQQQRTGSTYRNPPVECVTHLQPKGPRACDFFALISVITSSSRSRSATSFFSRAFSCSTCRIRRTFTASSCPNRFRQRYIVCAEIPCFLAASATVPASASRRIRTICSSENRLAGHVHFPRTSFVKSNARSNRLHR